jgi:phage shock protein PspC (stress-responsive transcriptional regulator)
MMMIPLLFVALFLVVCIGAMIAVLVTVLRNSNHKSALPPRYDEPMRVERVERISREIEKINAMEAAGRISAEEAAELKQALEGQRREWADDYAEFARQSGSACADFARKPLTKSSNRILAGICGGLADWLGCDATLIRVVYVLLSLFSAAFPGFILYIILWLIMPAPGATAGTGFPPASPGRGEKTGKGGMVLLLCLLAVSVIIVVMACLCFFALRTRAVHVHEQKTTMQMEQLQTPQPAPAVQAETP